MVVLNWHENLQKEEIPPEHLWEDSEGLEMWWATVEERRKNGEDGPVNPDRISVPDAADGDADHEGGMAENQLAAALKRG